MPSPRPAVPLRLITVRFSHFCEKARWALDRSGLAYEEESHVPVLSWRATLTAGGKRTVPCLLTPDGPVPDSTDILHWVDSQGGAPPLFPEGAEGEEVKALEESFDRRLGPAARRVAYSHLLQHPAAMRRLLASAGSGWEARLGAAFFPLLKTVIVRGLRIDDRGVERSRAALTEVFAAVETRLASGKRRYLVGERLTAADLTFASLATPLLLPEQLRGQLPGLEALPEGWDRALEPYRRSPAGQFALRLYAEERDKRLGQAPSPAA